MTGDTGALPIPCWTLPLTTAPSGSVAPDPGSASSAHVEHQGRQPMTVTEFARPIGGGRMTGSLLLALA